MSGVKPPSSSCMGMQSMSWTAVHMMHANCCLFELASQHTHCLVDCIGCMPCCVAVGLLLVGTGSTPHGHGDAGTGLYCNHHVHRESLTSCSCVLTCPW